MTNHSTQLNIFDIRLHVFKTTKRSSATRKFNSFIYNHNQAHKAKFMVEPVDVKPNNDATVITLVYIPVKHGKEA